MSAYQTLIDFIRDGEAVDAGHAGRPDRQLAGNLQFLKDQLDAIVAGQALTIAGVSCDPAAQAGQPVCWDPVQQRVTPALATLVFDSTINALVAGPLADILGVILQKTDSTTATLVLAGLVPIDLTAAVPDASVPGRYYLSGTTPGKLALQRPSLSVPVLYALGDGRAMVFPCYRNWELDHAHYKLDLVCRPAGTTSEPAINQRHTITNPDVARPGWLPANHAIFNGLAPHGAKFGYNLAQHPELARIWPPFPVEAATLVFNRGHDNIGGTEVPKTLAVADINGIWWLTDCYDNVPWPFSDSFVDGSESAAGASLSLYACPHFEQMTLQICFERALYDANQIMVTSLTPAPGSVVTLTDRAGKPATAGPLVIDAKLALLLGTTGVTGTQVLKGITPDGKLAQGPVVEGVISGSDGLVLTSTAPIVVNGKTVHQGILSASLNLNPVDREIPPALIRLQQTKDRFLDETVPYLGFPLGYVSSLTAIFNVPPAGLPANPQVVFRLTLLGLSAGALPALTCQYVQIPAGTGTPQLLPTSPSALVMPTPPATGSAFQYVLVNLPAVDVNAGDTLVLNLQRSASDGYSDELGLVRLSAVLTQG